MSGIWTEHRNAEGRTYWFNTGTRESVWEKPEVLKTPFERALGQTHWKEYFSEGRKYYYNTETKESKWDMPDELVLLLENVEKDSKASQQAANPRLIAPSFTQGASLPMGGADPSLLQSQQPGGPAMLNGMPNPAALAVGAPQSGFNPLALKEVRPALPSLPDDPVIPHNGFATVEEGEKAFMHLLRKASIDATWTWDQTMRAIITDPLYKALNSLAERKRCWQKYVDNLKEKEREEREARLAKARPALRNMLKGNPHVFHYTTFATADKLFSQHPIWQQAKVEAERKLIFEEYVAELKQREMQETRAVQARSINKVVAMFKKMNVDVLTRWHQAHTMLLNSDEWAEDQELRKLPSLDILLAFEDYSRLREREFEDQMRREQVEKKRKERKAREAFKELLGELVTDQKIRARTKWKDVYPLFQTDERYLNLLGNPGSNPIELFWDIVDNLDQELDAKVDAVEDAILRHNQTAGNGEEFEFNHETTWDTFLKLATDARGLNPRSENLVEADFKEIYESLLSDFLKKLEAERKRAERKQRHMQDDLRYALKKLPEPIDVNMSYEEAIPLMEDLPEYKALEDEGRRSAFSKYIKRQKERMRERELSEDGGSTTSRKRKEPPSKEKDHERDHREKSRDHDRERDRDYDKEESGRSSKHHRRGHDGEHESRRDREYRDRDRERDRDRDGYKSRYRDYDRERGRDRSDRDRDREERDERRREDRKASHGEPERDWEDPRYAVVHEGGSEKHGEREKRERERSVYSDRSEQKRARYDSEEPPKSAAPVREETPEEGEI